MEIAFHTKELRRMCESELLISKEFGAIAGRKLQNRIFDILSAESVDELPIKGIYCENFFYQLNFAKGKYILFEANHIKNPTNSDGSIDWRNVRRVKIVSIGGHGDDNQ